MKIFSLVGFGLFLVSEAWIYCDAYWDGLLSPTRPAFSSNFAQIPFLLGILLLFVSWVVALLRRRDRWWTTGVGLAPVVVILICSATIGSPYDITVRTVRDRILKVSTLDDLRRFAQTVSKDSPEILHSQDKSLDLTPEQIEAYGKMPNFSFLTWKNGHSGPSVRIVNGGVIICWGNGSEIWGTGVNVIGSKNDDQGYFAILRPSKDVYFFESE